MGLKAQKVGTLKISGVIEFVGNTQTVTSIKSSGVGVYTPRNGAAKVDLGLSCSLDVLTLGPQPCVGAIVQNFPSLNIALGSVTPITLNQASDGSFTFANTPGQSSTLVTGPLNSLSVVQPTAFTLTIGGGAANYGTTSVKGSASQYDVFPPPPVSWIVKDDGHHAEFSLAVTGPAGNSRATVTDTANGTTLATLLVDKSGTGSITYTATGKHFAVSNWLLAD